VNALVGGSTYKFKIAAVNIYGPGPFSDEISVLTSDVPDQVAIPTVSIVGTDVQISWGEPINNFEPITAYEIVLLTSTGNQVNDLTNCDGSQAAKVTARVCLIPMSQVINLTGLTQGSLIQARIRAYNANGWVAFG